MISPTTITSLAPVGQRAASARLKSFLSGGPSGMGSLGVPDAGLGIIPLIVAGASAAASMYAADQQAGAAEGVAAAGARGVVAEHKYAFKSDKKMYEAQNLQAAFNAVSGASTPPPTDNTALYVAAGLGVVLLLGVVLVMKGV